MAHVMQFFNRFSFMTNKIIKKQNDENKLSQP